MSRSASPSSRPLRTSTLRDVARISGVSAAIVSRALRRDLRISLPTRERVEQAARELDYRPESRTRLLWRGRRGRPAAARSVLAWIEQGADESPDFFSGCWDGASAAAESAGFRLERFPVGPDLSPRQLAPLLRARNIRGVLFSGLPSPENEAHFPRNEFFSVGLGRSFSSSDLPIVTRHEFGDVLLALQKIGEHGYRRVGFVVGKNQSRALAGFLAFQHQPGEMAADLLVLPEGGPALSGAGNRRSLDGWAKAFRPDVILSADPALDALLAVSGICAPGEIALATSNLSSRNGRAGVFLDSRAVGEVAVQSLISFLDGRHPDLPFARQGTFIRGTWTDGETLPRRVPADA